MEPGGEEETRIPLRGNYTLEICLSKVWTNQGDAPVNFEFSLHGLKPTKNVEMVNIDYKNGFLFFYLY